MHDADVVVCGLSVCVFFVLSPFQRQSRDGDVINPHTLVEDSPDLTLGVWGVKVRRGVF